VLDDTGFDSRPGKDFPKHTDLIWTPHNLVFSGYRDPYPGAVVLGREVTTHCHPVPRLRMSQAVPLLPACVFMARTGRNLNFTSRLLLEFIYIPWIFYSNGVLFYLTTFASHFPLAWLCYTHAHSPAASTLLIGNPSFAVSLRIFMIHRLNRGSNPCGGEVFWLRPERRRGPHGFLYGGYLVSFPWVNRPWRSIEHPPPSSVEVEC
jgi:hypothetical protein